MGISLGDNLRLRHEKLKPKRGTQGILTGLVMYLTGYVSGVPVQVSPPIQTLKRSIYQNLTKTMRGAAGVDDAQGTPAQSHISLSSYAKAYLVIYDSGPVPRRAIFFLRATSPSNPGCITPRKLTLKRAHPASRAETDRSDS